MLEKTKIAEIKSFLAFVLRHKPHFYKIKLDSEGFADFNKIIELIKQNKKVEISKEELIDIIKTKSGGIFQLNSDKTKIKARSGHSIIYNMNTPEGFIEINIVPKYLYCLIYKKEIMSIIQNKGLNLSNDVIKLLEIKPELEENKSILKIDSEKAIKTNKFYYNSNTKEYFCKFIPTQFLILNVQLI
jgi:putative RNA 2'-phosphotransferase